MIGYMEQELSQSAVKYLRAAETLVARAPAKTRDGWVRCHELTRAVGMIIGLSWIDGRFGIVEHSWLELAGGLVLDVYAVGSLPQVQICDVASATLRGAREYREGPARDDIDDRVITWLCRRMLGDERARLPPPPRRPSIPIGMNPVRRRSR